MPSVLSRPTQPAHRWILLFDGTSSDKDAAAPTNISRLDELVVNDPDGVQITRYSTGVGTGLNCVVQVFGGITGRGLHSKIRKAYDYLARNYREGDEVILAGYSRGAFTPLVLSAFLDRIGIPRFRSNAVYRMLWKKFENQELEDPETCRNLRNQFCCVDVPIKLLLAIDAVGAEGSPRTGVLGLMKWTPSRFKKLSFCLKELPRNVLRFRHALAIHEYRKPFTAIVVPIAVDNPVDALQVWFPGSHRDLGKGVDVLMWCVAQMSESGVKFDHEAINRIFPGYHTCPDLADPAKFGHWRPAVLHPTYKNQYKLTGWQARIPGGKILKGAQTREAIHIRARYRPFGLTPESQTVIDGHYAQQNYDGRFYWLKRGSWYSNGTWTPKEAPLRESKSRPPVNMGKIPEADVGQMEAKLSLCLIE